MPSTNHGSSKIWRHINPRFDLALPISGTNTFMLGLNAPYGGRPYPPKAGELMAAPDQFNGPIQRVDDWEHGATWQPKTLPGMGLCIGAARSGKGAGLIIPALLTYAGNAVTNDPKGENAWLTMERRRKPKAEGGLGKKVVLADPFNEVNRAYGSLVGVTETVTRYNPLADLDPASEDFSEDVAAIGEAIAIQGQNEGGNSEFFGGAGRDMIDGLIAATVTGSAPGRGTLRNVRQWLTLDNAAFGQRVTDFCEEYPDSLAAGKLRQFVDMTDRTNIGIKATAKQQTVFLDSEQLLRYMEPEPGETTFSFKELATGNLDIFLVLPATHTVTFKRWTRLMVNQSMRAILRARSTRQDLPVVYFLDEAGTTLGHLDVVENAYGLTSGMGLLCWSFYQDLSQMQRDYPKSWPTFIANSASIQLPRVGDLTTAEYFSKYMGNMTVATTGETISTSSNASGTGSSQSQTSGETGRPAMTPDELMRVPPGEQIVLVSGMKPMQQFKIRYYEDARFNGLYRPDPTRQSGYPAPVDPPPHEGEAVWAEEKTLGKRLNISLGVAAFLLLFLFGQYSGLFMLPFLIACVCAAWAWYRRSKLPLPSWVIVFSGHMGNAQPRPTK
jgi:type IV secretion system protein VirD4